MDSRQNLGWRFPPTGGGVEQDFNHPGQETFKAGGPWKNVIREVVQNSLDAADSSTKPVRINIREFNVSTSEIGADHLLPHIRETLKVAKEQKNDSAIKAYNNAASLLSQREIKILAITDTNTTGLRPKNLEALVYREGRTEKTGNSGGSFGIGKFAPYLVSDINTVCYVTSYSNPDKTDMFIGKAILAAHKDPEGEEMLQHVGYFGSTETPRTKKTTPIKGSNIYNKFRLTKPGTSILIAGFNPNTRSWALRATESVVENFFASIHVGKLSVTVCDNILDVDSLDRIMMSFSNTKEERCYYEAIRNPDGERSIEGEFGKFIMKYMINRDHLPSRVVYINRKGMIITDAKQSGTNPLSVSFGPYTKYVAVIQAANDETDKKIREMEPPSHKSIRTDQITSAEKREKYEKQLAEIKDGIKSVLDEVLGEGLRGGVLEADEVIDFFPIDIGGGQKIDSGNRRRIKTVARPLPTEIGVSIERVGAGEGRTKGANGGTGIGIEAPSKSTTTRGGAGEGKASTGKAYLVRRNSVRMNERLRISFDNTADTDVMIGIRLAGEERRNNKITKITDAHILAPVRREETPHDGWVTIHPCKERITIEVGIPTGSEYSGFELVEKHVAEQSAEPRNTQEKGGI